MKKSNIMQNNKFNEKIDLIKNLLDEIGKDFNIQ